MRKILKILLVAMMCCGMLDGCGNNSEELEKLREENRQLKEELKRINEKSDSDVTGKDDNKQVLDEMKLNEFYEVNTERGAYKIMIQGAYLTDWYREDDGKQVIALKYEVENIDFKTGELYNGKDGCLIDSNAFKVSDDNGYMLNPWNATMSEYGFPEITEPGFKSKEELPYVVDTVPSEISVVLYGNTGDIANITVPIEK